MVIQEPVQAAVWQCLNHYAYRDAVFLAERLYAEVSTDEALFLLATCYYRSGKPESAYRLLTTKSCPMPQCRYLLAQCCIDLDKMSEAEVALTGNIFQRHRSSPEDLVNDFGEVAPFTFRLLAKIYSKTERNTKAVESHRKCLRLNPFMWSAFETLCHLDEKPDPAKVFTTTSTQHVSEMCQTACGTPQAQTPLVRLSQSAAPTLHEMSPVIPVTPTLLSDVSENVSELSYVMAPPENLPSDTKSKPQLRSNRHFHSNALKRSPLTPSFGLLALDISSSPSSPQTVVSFATPSPIPPLIETMAHDGRAPVKKRHTQQQQQQQQQLVQSTHTRPSVFSQSGNTMMRDISVSTMHQVSNNMPGLRRSSRLFSSGGSSVKENNNKTASQRKFVSTKAPMKKLRTRLVRTQQELNELNKSDICALEGKAKMSVSNLQQQITCLQRQSADGLMQLLQDIGRAYVCLCKYDCTKAIQLFNDLPMHQHNTGWVRCQIGKAYFEMSEYQKAEKVFSEVRQLAKHHIEGMEIYSTTLWHLQREVQLSTLAQELAEFNKNSPEAWCAMGNCFSLQKEHDVAIKFFQRAVQVDKDFAYAYTLLGHEYVLTEELDRAMACFRNALRINPRHYNGWYGLGMIYYKQEKFTLAEVHFRKALAINPYSCVLLCHIGVVQHALKKSESALTTLNRAIAADPKNPLCKFHRASILFANDRHKEALKELEELKEIVPKESLVYFLIGKVHKKLGNTHLALMNFSWAMDLDPKGANNQIKEAIDKRYVNDEDEPATGLNEASFLEGAIEGSSNDSSLMEAEDIQLRAVESDESL
ncbi:cell division cycle 27 [Lamellibrachia satsuma]|nr:cell division cycle 27 [Lamellibrachia satsuma]